MHIHALRIRNFRRLKDVMIDFNKEISIFVGANNSGKTSTVEALKLFTNASRERFSIYDFNAICWKEIDEFGEQTEGSKLPSMTMDIWFHVEAGDVHRVIDLLPGLKWEGKLVGLRIVFTASDEISLIRRFAEARDKARANIRPGRNGSSDYHPFPRTLCEYLSENLKREFELRYYVLDQARFNHDTLIEEIGYIPLQIVPEKGRGGKEILNALIRVDFLSAQRHLSDNSSGSRAEDLSRRFSRFYEKNLEKCSEDYDAMQALAESETMLNQHLTRVFQPTLRSLADLGYPGMANPQLIIKSELNPATIMSNHDGAAVHYALGSQQNGARALTLPERYNGLGFKNLIYMVVELLDLHAQWICMEENRPPLHLIFIEEPEAHLHAQLQQVFIRKVVDILLIQGTDLAHYHSQLIVTTHSPHILYERGFQPIRYFRRHTTSESQESMVLNLSEYYNRTDGLIRDFLERYLKLTHCDLFFADAAVLVEGNVERLLIPAMIEKVAPKLTSAYLSILEIGGAFGHRFQSLIEFLGITTLIVTDIDSVGQVATTDAEDEGEDGTDEEVETPRNQACMVHVTDAVTSNQTLIKWLPGKLSISALLSSSMAERTQQRTVDTDALVHVTYQCLNNTVWQGESKSMTGRTLEEAFAYENLTWCQDKERSDLSLRVRGNSKLSLDTLAERIHKKVSSKSFNKTDFALALLIQDPNSWNVPKYIEQGLMWLQKEIAPESPSPDPVEGGAE